MVAPFSVGQCWRLYPALARGGYALWTDLDEYASPAHVMHTPHAVLTEKKRCEDAISHQNFLKAPLRGGWRRTRRRECA